MRRCRRAHAAAVELLEHAAPATSWYSQATPELLALAAEPAASGGAVMTLLAPTLGAFVTEWLIGQGRASLQTVACYRDAFRLLLAFGCERIGAALVPLRLEDRTLR